MQNNYISIADAARLYPNCIRTFSGNFLNVFNPKESDFNIEDIAVALSRIPRFAGHLRRNTSVAEHSIKCYLEAKRRGLSLGIQLQALMHDSAEAFILDFPSPIKRQMPDYKYMENNLMKVISNKFCFKFPFDAEIKEIDFESLQIEWEDNMFSENIVSCLDSDNFSKQFLSIFNKLTEEILFLYHNTI